MEESKANRILSIARRLDEIEKRDREIRDGWEISSVFLIHGGSDSQCVPVNREGTRRAIAALLHADLTGDAQGLWAELATLSTGGELG